ncbi:MAG: hypothetical protein CL902_11895 [Dehalococcoidia bacterium]|nr:hypothetical protein [Dehalococcoidia bacterium]|tara:strand:- start:52 stop:369 length:318 start_codon:yes stop_codon:yes gene_type:complete
MAILHTRIFQAKPGQAGPLVEHFKVAIEQMKSHGMNWDTRISTDYYSGRSDRVKVEWVVEDLGDVDADVAKVMEIPEAAAFLGGWIEQLNNMINYSDADNWTIVE